jgi:DNA-binding MarR family transcriptional regulator
MSRGPRQDGLFEPGLFLQFFLAMQPIGRLIESAIRESNMTASEYAVLSVVDELAPVTPADISRLTGVPRPTLTAQIDRLIQVGLVRRRSNPRDGRSYLLSLTASGRQTKDRNGRALFDANRALEGQLEDDADELTAALGRLRVAAEAALEAPRAERGTAA